MLKGFWKKLVMLVLCGVLIGTEGNVIKADEITELSSDENKPIYTTGNKEYYIDGNDLIKVEVEEAMPKVSTSSKMFRSGEQIITKDKEIVAHISSRELNYGDIEILRSGPTSGWLTRSDEKMNTMKNIKAKLSVVYADNSDQVFSDGYYLNIKSATGTFTQVGAYEGVIPQTSELYYRIQGRIFDSSGNLVGKVLTDTIMFSSPAFYNISIMPSDYYVDPAAAGVTYTLHCTRSVDIELSMPFALYG